MRFILRLQTSSRDLTFNRSHLWTHLSMRHLFSNGSYHMKEEINIIIHKKIPFHYSLSIQDYWFLFFRAGDIFHFLSIFS